MSIKKKISWIILFTVIVFNCFFTGCTKIGNGYLSPFVAYPVNEFSFISGRVASTLPLTSDGSSVPMHIKWLHIYDSTGKVVDHLFSKKYAMGVWTAAYDPTIDLTFADIMKKRGVDSFPAIMVNETNGIITSTQASLYLPVGVYSLDLQVSNSVGSQELKNIMKIRIVDGAPLETTEFGSFSNALSLVNNAAVAKTLWGTGNNPFIDAKITRLADTPNTIILKVMDRNGVPFNPRTGELTKRPNTGLNPKPPFLQNLQDYAPDFYQENDAAISIRYPLVPFPMVTLGNGFNMYYKILSSSYHVDSTSAWTANTPGNIYKGTADSHYRGQYPDNKYDYFLRIPMRVQVPGAYEIAIKIPNLTHR